MAKVMISIPDDELRAIDEAARGAGTTRSGLIRHWAQTAMSTAARHRAADRIRAMAAIDAEGSARGHGGGAAALVKKHRPQ